MKESQVENKLVQGTQNKGGIAYKFVSPNHRGVPDRLVLLPLPDMLSKVLKKYMYFVECKAPGKKARPDQLREHAKLRALGYRVRVLDTVIK